MAGHACSMHAPTLRNATPILITSGVRRITAQTHCGHSWTARCVYNCAVMTDNMCMCRTDLSKYIIKLTSSHEHTQINTHTQTSGHTTLTHFSFYSTLQFGFPQPKRACRMSPTSKRIAGISTPHPFSSARLEQLETPNAALGAQVGS